MFIACKMLAGATGYIAVAVILLIYAVGCVAAAALWLKRGAVFGNLFIGRFTRSHYCPPF